MSLSYASKLNFARGGPIAYTDFHANHRDRDEINLKGSRASTSSILDSSVLRPISSRPFFGYRIGFALTIDENKESLGLRSSLTSINNQFAKRLG